MSFWSDLDGSQDRDRGTQQLTVLVGVYIIIRVILYDRQELFKPDNCTVSYARCTIF